jgi:hypothetical protein
MKRVTVSHWDDERPNIRYDPPTDEWVVETAFEVSDHAARRTFTVPKGFRCDGASIPRLLWRVIGKHELGEIAPTVHDFIYRGHVPGYTQPAGDLVFDALMELDGVKPWKRTVAYRTVRVCGTGAWEKGHR